ncbi:hypothetical protein BH20ACT2_BH20ACT2_05290 [soil metagenome]
MRVVGVRKQFVLRKFLPWKVRARVSALVGTDLPVEAGSIHAILGGNGSGKSTLLRILATLVIPDEGEAHLGDVDVIAHPAPARRLLGFSTGDERSVYLRLTGRQNLQFYAALHHLADPERAVAAALERVDLVGAADRPASTYSQGMARRLGLARAVLHEPPVLLLDEPTRSLDPVARDRFHEVLRDLREHHGTTVVLASHDLDEAAVLCDRVSLLHAGAVVDDLVPDDRSALRRALGRLATS